MPSPKRLPAAILTIAASTILLAVVVALDVTPWARGGYGWRWPYTPVALFRLLPLAAGLIVYITGAAWFYRAERCKTGLVWAFMGALIIPLLALLARHDAIVLELFGRTAGQYITGTHWAAARIDWYGSGWHTWESIAQHPEIYSVHVAVAPPGLPLWYAVLNTVLDKIPAVAEPLQRWLMPYQCHNYNLLGYTPGQWASATFGVFMPLWAALVVFPLHAAARQLKISPLPAVLWWPLVPALSAFTGTWYTFMAFPILLAFMGLVRGVERQYGFGWLVVSGCIMGMMIFSNYATIPQVGLFGFYTLIYYVLKERHTRHMLRPVIVGAWFGVGLMIPWVAYWIYTGVTPIDLFHAAFNLHLELERPYLPWVFLHPWDWLLWNGLPVLLVWVVGVHMWIRKREGQTPVLALALLAIIIALSISGTGRGESGRVWLMFTPFALLAAADALYRIRQTTPAIAPWMALSSANAILLIAVVGTLDAVGKDFTPPTPLSPLAVDYIQTNAIFSASDGDGTFALTGWHGESNGRFIDLSLRWHGLSQVTHLYWFGAVLVSPTGETTEPILWQPGESHGAAYRYPNTCWRPGQNIEDTLRLPLPQDAETGDWWVSLAVFGNGESDEGRLQVISPDDTRDVQIGLGPVVVTP